MLKFIKKYDITFPNALDPKGDLADRFKVPAHPIAYYISADGEILDSRIGGVTEESLKADFDRFFF